jgi:hypothetical protein
MIDEVAGLRSRGVSDIRLDKLGLEYRYITRYLRGELATLDDLRLELGIAIRQFAKGQLTWSSATAGLFGWTPSATILKKLATASVNGLEYLHVSRVIKSYKHIIWDWNGTILCDVELGIEIMNGLLRQRSLHLLMSPSYRDLFTIPVKDYYARLGFDFAKEPFEIVGKLWMDEYKLRKFECGPYDGIVGVLDRIQQLGIGQSILSAYSQQTLDQMVDHPKP